MIMHTKYNTFTVIKHKQNILCVCQYMCLNMVITYPMSISHDIIIISKETTVQLSTPFSMSSVDVST